MKAPKKTAILQYRKLSLQFEKTQDNKVLNFIITFSFQNVNRGKPNDEFCSSRLFFFWTHEVTDNKDKQ